MRPTKRKISSEIFNILYSWSAPSWIFITLMGATAERNDSPTWPSSLHFMPSVRISVTGSRYSVKLPWKEDHDSLPDNYMNSQARMKGQLRRLKREPEMLKEYDRIIKEQAEQGIIEQVTSLEKADKVHYLPHQGCSDNQGTHCI